MDCLFLPGSILLSHLALGGLACLPCLLLNWLLCRVRSLRILLLLLIESLISRCRLPLVLLLLLDLLWLLESLIGLIAARLVLNWALLRHLGLLLSRLSKLPLWLRLNLGVLILRLPKLSLLLLLELRLNLGLNLGLDLGLDLRLRLGLELVLNWLCKLLLGLRYLRRLLSELPLLLLLLLRLHWLDALVALCIEARVNRRLGVSKLLSTLQRRMLCLLPRWDIWGWRNVHTGHRIRVCGHVRLHPLTRERRRYIRWLLFVRAQNRIGGWLPCGRSWTREGTCLISAID